MTRSTPRGRHGGTRASGGSRRRICTIRNMPGWCAIRRSSRCPGAVGSGHPLRHREAEPEVRGLWGTGGVAPGLGVLPAHQRRSGGGRRDVRRHGTGERPADDHCRQPSRPDPRPPHRRRVLRRDASGEPRCGLQQGDRAHRQGGSITVHHVRAVHGSAPNVSDNDRRLLLFQFRTAEPGPCSVSPPASRSSGSSWSAAFIVSATGTCAGAAAAAAGETARLALREPERHEEPLLRAAGCSARAGAGEMSDA